MVINTRNPTSVVYVELTQSPDLSKPQKLRQRQIMESVRRKEPFVKYCQYNGPFIRNLENSLIRDKMLDEVLGVIGGWIGNGQRG